MNEDSKINTKKYMVQYLKEIFIYCDESCHLENDVNEIMGLGAISCPADRKDYVFEQIRELKLKHGLKKDFEIKWTKISDSKVDFYLDIINLFFNVDYLKFRSVIINKSTLDHGDSSHDEFYYKMNFLLIKQLLEPTNKYKIFLDRKDTNGRKKIEKLHDYLCNDQFDFKKEIVTKVQEVVSNQIELIQLCDLLLGAVCYANKKLKTSPSKLAVVKRIQDLSGYSLIKSTFPSESKMNTFIWVGYKKTGNDEH